MLEHVLFWAATEALYQSRCAAGFLACGVAGFDRGHVVTLVDEQWWQPLNAGRWLG